MAEKAGLLLRKTWSIISKNEFKFSRNQRICQGYKIKSRCISTQFHQAKNFFSRLPKNLKMTNWSLQYDWRRESDGLRPTRKISWFSKKETISPLNLEQTTLNSSLRPSQRSTWASSLGSSRKHSLIFILWPFPSPPGPSGLTPRQSQERTLRGLSPSRWAWTFDSRKNITS